MTALWIAVAALSALGPPFGLVLGFAARRFEVEEDPVAEQIDEIFAAEPMWPMRLSWLSPLCRSGCQWRDDQQMRPGWRAGDAQAGRITER